MGSITANSKMALYNKTLWKAANETRYATFFDNLGIPYKTEKQNKYIDRNGNIRFYDFDIEGLPLEARGGSTRYYFSYEELMKSFEDSLYDGIDISKEKGQALLSFNTMVLVANKNERIFSEISTSNKIGDRVFLFTSGRKKTKIEEITCKTTIEGKNYRMNALLGEMIYFLEHLYDKNKKPYFLRTKKIVYPIIEYFCNNNILHDNTTTLSRYEVNDLIKKLGLNSNLQLNFDNIKNEISLKKYDDRKCLIDRKNLKLRDIQIEIKETNLDEIFNSINKEELKRQSEESIKWKKRE